MSQREAPLPVVRSPLWPQSLLACLRIVHVSHQQIYTDEPVTWDRVNAYASPANATCYLLRWRGICQGSGLQATTVLPHFGACAHRCLLVNLSASTEQTVFTLHGRVLGWLHPLRCALAALRGRAPRLFRIATRPRHAVAHGSLHLPLNGCACFAVPCHGVIPWTPHSDG